MFDWYCIYNDATRKQVGCILTAVKGERFSCGEKRGDVWQSREESRIKTGEKESERRGITW